MAAEHVQHMQKALSQMNLQLHHVLSDLTGQSGLAILDAILAGERHPQALAELRDPRVKATPETIMKSLAVTIGGSICLPCGSRWKPIVTIKA